MNDDENPPSRDAIRQQIAHIAQLKEMLAAAQQAAEAVEAEGTDPSRRVGVTSRVSGKVTELFIEEGWYGTCSPRELATVVMEAHAAAKAAAADEVSGGTDGQ